MTDRSDKSAAIASAVFGASLTLVAILVGVVAVFSGQIGELESKGLGLVAKDTRQMLHAAVLLILASSWSAFWSFLYISFGVGSTHIFTFPLMISIFGIFIFVPYWAWIG